jgi:hypothetical protein
MEGRGDGLKGLDLGCSIDHSCEGLQHFWVEEVVLGGKGDTILVFRADLSARC